MLKGYLLKELSMINRRLIYVLFVLVLGLLACSDSSVSEDKEDEIVTADPTAISTATATQLPVASTTPTGLAGLKVNQGSRFVPLTDPPVIAAAEAIWLDSDQLVIGVEQNGEARAYPLSQMIYHYVANDTIGGEPYLVTY